jgi:hypothetical protein
MKPDLIMFAHYLDDANQFFLWKIVIVIVVFSWAVLAIITLKNARAAKRTSYGLKYGITAGCFIVAIASEFLIGDYIQWAAWQEVHPRLFAAASSVEVNGVRISNFESLILAMRHASDPIGHHSHPTKKYEVLLRTAAGSLLLDMMRDSEVHSEYWLYDPAFHAAYLGRVNTFALDAITKPD